MKRILILFGLVSLFATKQASAQWVFLDWYWVDMLSTMEEGGAEIKMTPIKGNLVPLYGARGGWHITPNFSLGMSASGNQTTIDGINNESLRATIGTFGIYASFNKHLDRRIYLNVVLNAGAGTAALTGFSFDDDEFSEFFVFEPTIGPVFKVTNNFRASINAGFRHTVGTGLSSLSDADLSGGSVTLSLFFTNNW